MFDKVKYVREKLNMSEAVVLKYEHRQSETLAENPMYIPLF